MLLAIDSSAGTSAAVLHEGELLSLAIELDPFGHAESIGRVMRDALAQAGVSATKIEAVVLGRGPAPYTGLRVGMAAAQAFAAPRQLPLLGVIALDAVAQQLVADGAVAAGDEFAVASDAKRREFFVRRYRATRPLVEALDEPTVAPAAPEAAHHIAADAAMIARYAWQAQILARDLSDISALYLRSPDVMPSSGKRVTG